MSIMKLPDKIINIYDNEKNPIEKCDKIKTEWNVCCNKYLKNIVNDSSRNTNYNENTRKCLKLFDEYTNCLIEHFSGQKH